MVCILFPSNSLSRKMIQPQDIVTFLIKGHGEYPFGLDFLCFAYMNIDNFKQIYWVHYCLAMILEPPTMGNVVDTNAPDNEYLLSRLLTMVMDNLPKCDLIRILSLYL